MANPSNLIDFVIEDDIVISTYKEGLEINLIIAKQMVAERLAFQNGKSYKHVIIINNVKSVDKPARKYFSEEGAKYIICAGFVVNTFIEKVMLNFFLSVDKPQVPTKFFTKKEGAINWAKQMKQFD